MGKLLKKSPLEVKILRMTWGNYFSEIIKIDSFYKDRIKLIAYARELFRKYEHFQDISDDDRKKIAGIEKFKDGINWYLFGNVSRPSEYNSAIKRNDPHISKALDFIPNAGEIAKTDYNRYYEEFKKAFPSGRGYGISSVTRLLAMKRPDYFLSLNNENSDKFSEAFGIASKIRPENYWFTVVEQIKKCYWWDSPSPIKKDEEDIWAGRAAFLDGLFYEE